MFTLLLALGLAVVALCHTDAAQHQGAASAAVVAEQVDAHGGPLAEHHEGHCDETDVLADQRSGTVSASLLLGLAFFAFPGLPVLPPRLTPLSRSARAHRVLPLGGTRALLSLCVRRV
ncbi:hypothetical protein NE857_25995 [Nocardiopsis exhalans]|uniref:Secreted protein n=1 Tax=Nocardiopsis exhalans TaxID=163604 RepID=A0ABY5D4Q0_9ACTN|nr:hypothetical protein [Nocardiopsis exhalans]USY18711.1 hypothetical protein NE857_25995 [Nocardiopsis exhalans]